VKRCRWTAFVADQPEEGVAMEVERGGRREERWREERWRGGEVERGGAK
jgi:hypothetical protein